MTSHDEASVEKPTKRRIASVYDAVAGRVGYEGFLSQTKPSKYRDTPSTSSTAVPPEEILYRRKNAPSRYEEDDVYSADRHLSKDERLPDSDLLKAIHAYAADFYGAETNDQGYKDFQSFDETALLAIGILLEEAANSAMDAEACTALLQPAEKHSYG